MTQAKQAELLIEEGKLYAENIVATVRGPLLVLDTNARVKTANPAFYEMFQVSPHETLNAFLYDLRDGQWDIPELRRLLGEVLPTNRAVEDFEVKRNFPAMGHRTMLLNARPDSAARAPRTAHSCGN